MGVSGLRFYRVEAALALVGLVCLVNAAAGWWRFHHYQAQYATAFTSMASVGPGPSSAIRLKLGEPIGRLTIPRLHLATVLVEGADDKSLQFGAGRAVESARIGGQGNVVLAGHRDTAFWPLRNAKVGDRIRIDADRKYSYVIQSLSIVEPADTSLLKPSSRPLLTLVTCYPFRHVGPAPKRFVIRASLVSN